MMIITTIRTDENVPLLFTTSARFLLPDMLLWRSNGYQVGCCGRRAGRGEVRTTASCKHIPQRKMATLENVRKFLAHFVRQIQLYRNDILRVFFCKAFVLFLMTRMSFQFGSHISLIFAFFCNFLTRNNIKIGLFSFCSPFWTVIALYLALKTEIIFASHLTAHNVSSMRPGVLFAWFWSPEECLAPRRHAVNIF